MGAWGSAAWDNDLAADWFAELFETTKLARRVEKTLNRRDLEEYAPEIRAAAYVLIALGRNYVWPVDELERHLQLAISKLEALRELADYEGMPELDEEIAVLRSRLDAPNPLGAAAERLALTNRLRDPDPAVRLQAAREFSKQALAETSNETEARLGNSDVTGALIEALGDSDPRVAAEAVIAVAEVTRRYFRDERAYPGVVRLFQSKSIQTRAWAVEAAGALRGAGCLNDILPLLRDRASGVRNAVLGVISQACEETQPDAATRERLLAAIRPLMKDKDAEVRSSARALRRLLGSPRM
jgi:HEAT repeat protein